LLRWNACPHSIWSQLVSCRFFFHIPSSQHVRPWIHIILLVYMVCSEYNCYPKEKKEPEKDQFSVTILRSHCRVVLWWNFAWSLIDKYRTCAGFLKNL
jgi:hypothetical protein